VLVDGLFVDIYKKRETIDIKSSLRAYLARAVKNRCLDVLELLEYKKKAINFSTAGISDEYLSTIADKGDCPLGILLEKESEQELEEAIKRLPIECRTVFEKSRIERKKHKKIAAEMGISVNTVKYHIKNALARLQEDLKVFYYSH